MELNSNLAVVYGYHPAEALANEAGGLLERARLPNVDVIRYRGEPDEQKPYMWWTPNLNRFLREINAKNSYKFNVVLHSSRLHDWASKLLLVRYSKINRKEAIKQMYDLVDILEKMKLENAILVIPPPRDKVFLRGPDLIEFEFNERRIKRAKEALKLCRTGLYLLQRI